MSVGLGASALLWFLVSARGAGAGLRGQGIAGFIICLRR
jgi:hypothetical protein